MGVAGFASFADPTKAHEVANEVRRTMKSLAECQESANMYNTRERLFGLPTTESVVLTIRKFKKCSVISLHTESFEHRLLIG